MNTDWEKPPSAVPRGRQPPQRHRARARPRPSIAGQEFDDGGVAEDDRGFEDDHVCKRTRVSESLSQKLQRHLKSRKRVEGCVMTLVSGVSQRDPSVQWSDSDGSAVRHVTQAPKGSGLVWEGRRPQFRVGDNELVSHDRGSPHNRGFLTGAAVEAPTLRSTPRAVAQGHQHAAQAATLVVSNY